MPSKAIKRIVSQIARPTAAKESVQLAPIEEACLSDENIAALHAAADRLKTTPARAFSKVEIRQQFKKIKKSG
jgi:hypothetical protein